MKEARHGSSNPTVRPAVHATGVPKNGHATVASVVERNPMLHIEVTGTGLTNVKLAGKPMVLYHDGVWRIK